MSRVVARDFITDILSSKARNSSSESRNLQLQENNVLQCCNLFSKSCAKFQINYCKRIPGGTFELINATTESTLLGNSQLRIET